MQIRLQRGVCGVIPQAQTAGADAPVFSHGGSLKGDHGCTAVEQVGPVGQVPVCRLTVVGSVLAHGGNDDAVGQCQAALWARQRKG